MNRLDFYFRQRVTEAELDLGFTYAEQALWDLAADVDLIGVSSGLAVAQQGTPNMTAAVSAGAAYDGSGRRIRVPSTQNVNLAVDYNGVTTVVTNPSNEKYLSVYVGFARTLTDPRTDGNSLPVYFSRAESFELRVVQGAEATIGTAARPALDSGRLLLADVRLVNGQTTVVTANIQAARRQDTFVASGSPRALQRSSAKAAFTDLLGYYNAHVGGSADKHPATAIDYAGVSPGWANGDAFPATTVEGAIDKIVTDLRGASGIARVGAGTLGESWRDTTTVNQSTLFATLTRIMTDLRGDGGAGRIGADAQAGSPFSLSAGSVQGQLDALLAALNTPAANRIIDFGMRTSAGAVGGGAGTEMDSVTIAPTVVAGDKLLVWGLSHVTGTFDGTFTAGVEVNVSAVSGLNHSLTPMNGQEDFYLPLTGLWTLTDNTNRTIALKKLGAWTSHASRYLWALIRP